MSEQAADAIGAAPLVLETDWDTAMGEDMDLLAARLSLQVETLTFLADTDQALCLYTAEAGSPSAEALALLASCSAPSSPAPATHT
jgi:hypothetical protein